MAEATQRCRENGASRLLPLQGGAAEALRRTLADLDREGRPVLETRLGVLPTQVARVMDAAGRAGQRWGLSPRTVAHLAHGVLQGTWHPLERGGATAERVASLVDQLREAVGPLDGYVVVEACPPQVKGRLDPWGEAGEPWQVTRALKEQYDPRGILNPGRFVGGL